jgi:hypothetical protein
LEKTEISEFKANEIPNENGAESDELHPHHILQFFTYDHLPAKLQTVSKPFGDLATKVVEVLPANSERDNALRKLLEAKDCAVRALLYV